MLGSRRLAAAVAGMRRHRSWAGRLALDCKLAVAVACSLVVGHSLAVERSLVVAHSSAEGHSFAVARNLAAQSLRTTDRPKKGEMRGIFF